MGYDSSKVKKLEIENILTPFGYDEDMNDMYCKAIDDSVNITIAYRGPNIKMQPRFKIFYCDKSNKKTFDDVDMGGDLCPPMEKCKNRCECYGCVAACGELLKWSEDQIDDEERIDSRVDDEILDGITDRLIWVDLINILDIHGYVGFTQDSRYVSAVDKIMHNSLDTITKDEYTQILGAIKSAESTLSKSQDSDAKGQAYFLRQVLYHGHDLGIHSFASLKDKYGGCFIATEIYGSYNSNEVLVLRTFRDEYLEKRPWGQKFVQIYYTFGPGVAEKLSNNKRLCSFIRVILDRYVILLSQKNGTNTESINHKVT